MAAAEGTTTDALKALGDINDDEIDGVVAGTLSNLNNILKKDHPCDELFLGLLPLRSELSSPAL